MVYVEKFSSLIEARRKLQIKNGLSEKENKRFKPSTGGITFKICHLVILIY